MPYSKLYSCQRQDKIQSEHAGAGGDLSKGGIFHF
jgi:hypothetical protein